LFKLENLSLNWRKINDLALLAFSRQEIEKNLVDWCEPKVRLVRPCHPGKTMASIYQVS